MIPPKDLFTCLICGGNIPHKKNSLARIVPFHRKCDEKLYRRLWRTFRQIETQFPMTDRHHDYNHSTKGKARTKRRRAKVSADLPKCSICGGAIPRRPNSIAIAIGCHRQCNVTLYRQEEVRRRAEK